MPDMKGTSMQKVRIIIDTTGPMFKKRPRQEVAMILQREGCAMASSDTEHTPQGARTYRRNLYASDGKVAGSITVK